MKKTNKLITIATAVVALTSLVGCKPKAEIQIGILQIETHGALDSARRGFNDVLNESDLKGKFDINYENPEGNSTELTAMAKTLIRSSDLVLAIATPTATALKAAAITEGKETPILFTAVTDPVDAELVASNEAPGGFITGTNDMNPVQEQISLIKQLVPTIAHMGILYTASETNSKVQSDLAEAQAVSEGLIVTVSTVSDATDITATIRQMVNQGIGALYIPTDNNLAKNMPAVRNIANELDLPVICGEGNMVEAGGLITLGIDYYELGRLTGEMALKILKGEATPATMAVEALPKESYAVSVNLEVAAEIGITIPQELLDRVEE